MPDDASAESKSWKMATKHLKPNAEFTFSCSSEPDRQTFAQCQDGDKPGAGLLAVCTALSDLKDFK